MQDKARLIERIKKLLAVASDNPDEAEAAAALNKAYILMEANNLTIDEVLGRRTLKEAETKESQPTPGRSTREPEMWQERADSGLAQADEGPEEGGSGEEADRKSGSLTKWLALAVLSSILSVTLGPSLPGPLALALLIVSGILWIPGAFCLLGFINDIFRAVFKKNLV